MSFKDKIVLITGANRGIGRAIAEKFMIEDATIVGTSTSESGVEIINSYLKNKGKGIKCDISSIYSIKFLLKEIHKTFGCIDILVNNAGIIRDNLLVRMKENEWKSVIETNLISIFHISKEIVKSMIRKRYGRIITIGSIVGSTGNIGQTSYAATKAGLIGFSKSLAQEVASRGITVNVVSPGFILTNMTKVLTEKQRINILSKIPLNRFGNPEEVANAVMFFASNKSSYITGETIHVNGGMFMS